MSFSNDPEERNSTTSKRSNIIYAREYLLSGSELEICRRLPEGIDKSFLSEFRSLPEQGFSCEYGSPRTICKRVFLPPREGSTGSTSNDLEERNLTTSKSSKIIYAREFLLSLSELEKCKRLPEGIEDSFLSEFRSSPEQGFRRNEYSSSAPGKGETGNFSRGFQKWDSRSSWRSDSNPQSDRESDSGRRYGNPFRRAGQNQEHDGLLGSGSIARPPGYGPPASSPPTPTSAANDQHHLNRSNDPYHPPRPYKAAPTSWRETKDSLNDETFGSSEATDEDRVEEERKRRAEFEMMRKEQQKELQERLKLKTMNELKDSKLAASVDARENAIVNIGLDATLVKTIQENDTKVSVSSQGHPFRPLMPPGFANAATKNTYTAKSFDNPLEMKKPETEDYNQGIKTALQPRLDDKHPDKAFPRDAKSGKKVNISSASDLSSKLEDTLSLDPSKNSGLCEISSNNQLIGIPFGNDSERKFVGNSAHSASVLGKLFEGASNTERVGPSAIIEDDNMKEDTYISPKDNQSSKFAQWFYEEERRPVENESLNKPTALFSLIAGENSGSVTSDTLSPKQIRTPNSNLTVAPNYVGVSGPVYKKNKPEYNSAVLTCEDLEQSIISDLGVSSSRSEPHGVLSRQQHGLENEVPLADISNKASQHLLSLLQKGGISSCNSKTVVTHKDDLVKGLSLDIDSKRTTQGNSISRGDVNAEKLRRSEKDLTLETLFGAAFMNELQSSSDVADSPLNMVKPEMGYERQSMHAHSSPPPPPQFLHPTMVNNGRPVFSPHLVQHIDQQHLMALEGTNHRQDAGGVHHPNSANLGHPKPGHPNSGGGASQSQFDHSIHHPILLQQMRISNLHSPPPPAASLLPGIAHPPHSRGAAGGGGGYHPSRVHDQNPGHSFPYGQLQPNPGLLQQGGQYRNLDSSNLPQTFQSLLEMELRSNPKPNLPSFPGVDSRSRPGFGHELDPSFWYR